MLKLEVSAGIKVYLYNTQQQKVAHTRDGWYMEGVTASCSGWLHLIHIP